MKALHFGAGKIGRGFIAELLHDSGYEIVFADVVAPVIDSINKNKQYVLYKIDHNKEEKVIDNISAINSIENPEMVVKAVTECDIITTSVMATNLPKIAPMIAKGLAKRNDKIIVMACENAIKGTNILKDEVCKCGLENPDKYAFWPNTAVDRMVFDGKDGGIEIGDAFELAVEDIDQPKTIKGAEYVKDIMKFLQRKIYIINCGHAIAAYFGYQKNYKYVQDALKDNELLKDILGAEKESAMALCKEYGFKYEDVDSYMNNMMLNRFLTPGVQDEISRVAREPIRKLSPNDRIMGPANLCEKHNLDNNHLLKAAATAFKYYQSDDEQAVKINNCIKNEGIEKAIEKYTGAKPGTKMFDTILNYYNN